MTTVILPYKCNAYGDIELRYALRSAEKHLKGVKEIVLLGHPPSWLQNVTVIPTPDIDRQFDKKQDKERAIYEKIRLACYQESVTDNFLMMNDDHFLLQDFDAGIFPLYWSGDIWDAIEVSDGKEYTQTLKDTKSIISAGGLCSLYHDVHCPILYNKEKFLKLEELDWNKPFGWAIKTMYCSLNGLQGDFQCDLKFRKEITAPLVKQCLHGQPFFSTWERALGPGMLKVWNELYPNKSQYEK